MIPQFYTPNTSVAQIGDEKAAIGMGTQVDGIEERTFAPSPGRISLYHPPGGPGVRIDTHVYSGYEVPPFYDSLIGKLIVHGDDRLAAMARMRSALSEIVIDGIHTNIPLHQELCRDAAFLEGGVDIHFLERKLAQ